MIALFPFSHDLTSPLQGLLLLLVYLKYVSLSYPPDPNHHRVASHSYGFPTYSLHDAFYLVSVSPLSPAFCSLYTAFYFFLLLSSCCSPKVSTMLNTAVLWTSPKNSSSQPSHFHPGGFISMFYRISLHSFGKPTVLPAAASLFESVLS